MLFRDRAEVRLGARRTPYTLPASLLGVPYPLGLSGLIQIDLRLSGEKIRLRRNLASVTPHITCGRFYISMPSAFVLRCLPLNLLIKRLSERASALKTWTKKAVGI